MEKEKFMARKKERKKSYLQGEKEGGLGYGMEYGGRLELWG